VLFGNVDVGNGALAADFLKGVLEVSSVIYEKKSLAAVHSYPSKLQQ
jgi:hypothetical protein